MTDYPVVKIEDLKPGDTVVVTGGITNRNHHRFDTVVRLTATRIVCEKYTFMKNSLKRVGDSSEWYPIRLAGNGYAGTLMNVEEAKEKNEETKKENEHEDLARKLSKTLFNEWMKLPVEQLREIVEGLKK